MKPASSQHKKRTAPAPRAASATLPVKTPDGVFLAEYSAKGLRALYFPGSGRRASGPKDVPADIQRWHQTTSRALLAILSGKQPSRLPPIQFERGTPFQQSVWQALSRIACGKTRTYGEIARDIGSPAAVRAVGGACGANPIPVLIPCHRVLAANKRLGGFSGGLKWKVTLLQREGSWAG